MLPRLQLHTFAAVREGREEKIESRSIVVSRNFRVAPVVPTAAVVVLHLPGHTTEHFHMQPFDPENYPATWLVINKAINTV